MTTVHVVQCNMLDGGSSSPHCFSLRESFASSSSYCELMANKKKKPPTPKPSIPFLRTDEYDSSVKANALSWSQHEVTLAQENVRLKLNAVGDNSRDDDLFAIERLLLNQRNLLTHIAELYMCLEDPSVAHAVAVKESMDSLTARVEELQSDLDEHKRNNDHTRNGNEWS